MEWRCTWCGKPHPEDDPPCDNCGHNAFEKAIVRQDEREQTGDTDTESDSGSSSDTATGTETAVDTGTTYVWTCPDCGRAHVKNNPPCSRCGNTTLERTEQTYDDVDEALETVSWFAVAKPYTPIIAVVGIVALLFASGIVSPSILPGVGTPSPPDAPGNGTEYNGINLDAVEERANDQLAAARADDDPTPDEGLAAYAEYRNRVLVATEHGDGDRDHELPDPDEFNIDCRTDLVVSHVAPFETPIDADTGEGELAANVTEVVRMLEAGTSEYDVVADGFDLHVGPEGTIYVSYAAC
ncbi:hypothetical protein [Natrialba taiwanensis]|uniref:Uncharacterized protein n=1 Tax=Natrialba taiwanensis DSM 12281 TaxID=1230458 RepID=L9ZGD1_9EURY|nr:hypothetical protein [Natrialba taiwanensis]ELY85500.1 hypothetical protein C484_19317 [Natrialba taiwanensis DSM 12281]